MLRHTCPWSGMACPSTNSMPIGLQSARRIFPMSVRSVPKTAFCRYCGTMTMWYRPYHRTGLWLCHARMVVSPSCGLGGSTLGETTVLFTNQRRNGRACSSLAARGGGLPIGVSAPLQHRMKQKSEGVETEQKRGQVLLAVPKVVLQMVALGLEHVVISVSAFQRPRPACAMSAMLSACRR